MTAPGTSRLQFTVLPPIDWVINYAFLPRMRMQGQRQTIERHSASPLSSQALPRSAFLQLCLVGRQAGRHIRDQVYPSSAPLSSKMPPHLAMGLSSQTNPQEQPELGAPWGRPVGIGRIKFLTSPARSLAFFLSIPPRVFSRITLSSESPRLPARGPRPELHQQVLVLRCVDR